MTDNEITIKALKEIMELMLCEGGLQMASTISHALGLINRLQAENERLSSGKCVYLSDDETTEYCVEGICPKYKTEAKIKAEVLSEVNARFYPYKTDIYIKGEELIIIPSTDYEQILKELGLFEGSSLLEEMEAGEIW